MMSYGFYRLAIYFSDLRYDNQQCICFCFVLQTVYDVLHANITKEGSVKFT